MAAHRALEWLELERRGRAQRGIVQLFSSVAKVSAADVWAVGTFYDSTGNPRPLAEHWDGLQWNMVVPVTGGTGSTLTGVAVLSSNSIWSVGSYNDAGSVVHPIAEHYVP